MSFIQRTGERFARITNRREFLNRSATALFSLATAAAIRFDLVRSAYAGGYCPFPNILPNDCDCIPIGGNYCSGPQCNGYQCANGCSTTNKGGWADGCWCTAICGGGCHDYYKVCCDCKCGSFYCSCFEIFGYNYPKGPDC